MVALVRDEASSGMEQSQFQYQGALAEEQTNMEALLKTIAAGLVEDPASITVTEDAPDEEGVIVYHLHVAADDMGRVIGKQGRIAKAIRTIMRAGAARNNQKVAVEID